jgi:hypothetical protein
MGINPGICVIIVVFEHIYAYKDERSYLEGRGVYLSVHVHDPRWMESPIHPSKPLGVNLHHG